MSSPLEKERHDLSNCSKARDLPVREDEQGAGQGKSPAPCLDAGPRGYGISNATARRDSCRHPRAHNAKQCSF